MAIKLSKLLEETTALQSLAIPLKRLQRLQNLYLSMVPNALMTSTEIGFIDSNELVIFAYHGAAATNLRQRNSELFNWKCKKLIR